MTTAVLDDDADRLKRWDSRTLDLVETVPVGLVGVVCEDCKRTRPLEAVYTTRATHSHHCFDRAECAAVVAHNNAPWPREGGA